MRASARCLCPMPTLQIVKQYVYARNVRVCGAVFQYHNTASEN